MRKAIEIIKKMEAEKKNIEFLKTGLPSLDKALDGGFMRKEIILLGAFTGIGKSMFGGQIFYNMATNGFKSAYFSLEISSEMIVSRLIGQLANIKPARIMAGHLEITEVDRKAEGKAQVTMYNELMDFYDDAYLLSEIERAIKGHGYEFVVVDFIQNILLDNSMDEYARLSFIAVQLQKIAKETNCCILLLSQLSNKVGSNNSKVVEYKGSGAIAQVADLGFFLERENPEFNSLGQPVGEQKVKLILRKNRRGTSGIYFDLDFIHPGGQLVEKY